MNSLAGKSLPELPERLGGNPKDRIWNLLTLILLAATVCLVGVFALIFANPENFLNPFPPSAAALAQLKTATPFVFPPTWTPAAPSEPTVVSTDEPPAPADAPAQPSSGEAPTQPPATVIAPVVEASPVDATQPPARPGGYAFQLRGDPIQVSSAMSHPESSCEWVGVGGEVFDLQNSPLVGLTIQMGGRLYGKTVNMLSLTGTATQYGPAGYEFNLGDTPIDSNGSLWLQLLDQAGLPLSDRISISTSSDCKQNLLLVNFKQVK